MKNRLLVGGLAVAMSAFTCVWARAEEGLGELSGTGGVLRDAERRALAPSPAKQAEDVPVVTPGAVPEVADAVRSREIGEIRAVSVAGSREFAVRERIAERVMDALPGGGAATVGDIADALAKVRADLVKKGLYLARLSLARGGAYDRATGTLAIVVDEGRFGRIEAAFADGEGGAWFSKEQILRRFRGIREGETFDYTRLRALLFNANSHPDLTIDTRIDVRKPLEGEGEDRRVARYADLNLTVHESVPLHVLWQVDNFGVKEVNEWQTSLTAQYLNLTRRDDVLTVSPAMSVGAELVSVAGSYMLPHGYGFGGSTTLYGGWSQVQIDDIVPQLDLEGCGWFAGLQQTENLYDDDRHLLALSAGLLWRYLEDQYTAQSQSLKERGAHILPLSLALSYTGKRGDFLGGRNFATLQGVYNLWNGGDSLAEMWNEAEENYYVLRAQLARLQPLFGWHDAASGEELHNWQLFVKVEGQWTDQNVIPVEKLMLGGYNCLRGYRTRGYVGDYGVYGTVELRSPLLVDTFAALFGDRTDKVAIDRLQFLGFCDWGVTQYNDLPAGYDDNKFLCSAGFGARLAVTRHSQLRCDVAFPLLEGDNEEDRDVEVYMSAQVQF